MRSFALVVVVTLVSWGCGDAPAHPEGPEPAGSIESSETRVTLAVEPTDEAGVYELHVEYARGADAAGPRVVELRLEHSDNVSLLDFASGEAVERAGKELRVQERDGVFRTIVYSSSNIVELDSGRIATLRLKRDGAEQGRVSILVDQPIFAPQLAEQGLLVGDAVEL